jgi:cytochrome P450
MKTDDFQSPPLKQRQLGAFGLGRHFCPGRGVAFVMVGAALTVLLRDYELQIVQRPLRWTSMVIGGMARPMGQFRIRATPVKVPQRASGQGHDAARAQAAMS